MAVLASTLHPRPRDATRRYARCDDAALWIDQNNHIGVDGIARLLAVLRSAPSPSHSSPPLLFCFACSLHFANFSMFLGIFPQRFSRASLSAFLDVSLMALLGTAWRHLARHGSQNSVRARTAAASASSSSKSSRRCSIT